MFPVQTKVVWAKEGDCCSVRSFFYWEYACILNIICVVRRYQPAPEEQAWQSAENSFQNCRQCTHPSNRYIQRKTKQELVILSQTKLTPLIICSKYYHQANVFETSVRKQIALEIVLPPCRGSLTRNEICNIALAISECLLGCLITLVSVTGPIACGV